MNRAVIDKDDRAAVVVVKRATDAVLGKEHRLAPSAYVFSPIPGLELEIELPERRLVSLTLELPDQWADATNAGAWAAIAVDGRRVVQGLYRAAVPGQRVPLHLATDVEAEGVIKLQAQWSGFGDTAQLGITGYPVLRALVHPRGARLIDLG